jgi:hypothetical protein
MLSRRWIAVVLGPAAVAVAIACTAGSEGPGDATPSGDGASETGAADSDAGELGDAQSDGLRCEGWSDASLSLGEGGALPLVASAQHLASAAFDGTSWLLAWEEQTGPFAPTSAVYVALIGKDGDLRGAPVPVGADGRSPSVGFDGTSFVVVWGPDGIGPTVGVRVSSSCGVLDPTPFVIAPKTSLALPSVACLTDAHSCLVAYRVLAAPLGVNARLVQAGGVVGASATQLPGIMPLAVDTDGTNYCVVESAAVSLEGEVEGSIVDGTTGAVLGSGGVYATASSSIFPASIASDSAEHLLVYANPGPYSPYVYAQRIGTDGQAEGSPVRLSAYGVGPHVEYDGQHFTVAWLDGASIITQPVFGDGGAGASPSAVALPDLVDGGTRSEVTLSSDRNGSALLAYTQCQPFPNQFQCGVHVTLIKTN